MGNTIGAGPYTYTSSTASTAPSSRGAKRSHQVEELKKGHQDRIENNKRTYEERVSSLKEFFNKDKENTVKSYDARWKAEQKKVAEKIEKLRNNHNQEVMELRQGQEKERRLLVKEFQERLKELKASYENIIADKDDQMVELKYQHGLKLDNLNRRLKEKVQVIQQDFRERADILKESYDKDLEETTRRLRQRA